MKRLSFLFAVIVGACVIGTTARAQFSNNAAIEATTNITALVPIGNGFGVALLGYGLPESNVDKTTSSNYLFFATPMGQPSASDTTTANGTNQFYVVQTDRDGNNPFIHSDLFAIKVLSPVAASTNLTVVRTWLARVTTNNPGFTCAGSLAACGVTSNGTVILRVDSSSGVNTSTSQQGMFIYNADTLSTVVITNILTNDVALGTSCLVTQEGSATLKIGSVGKNSGLLAGNGFSFSQFVARADITFDDPILSPHGQKIASDNDRSAHSINDTARVLAYWKKTQDEVDMGSGSDACTHLAVFNYAADSGGNISITSSNDYAFGTRTGNNFSADHINTNAIDFFGAVAFNGPAHISINDNGEMAFPVSINCYVGNQYSNGTRSATVCGILWKDANSGTFRKVVDNADASLFLPALVPGPTETWGSTNNIMSPPVLDNRGNVFFTCGLTNFAIGGTNPISDVALFQSVPTAYPNPTSWTTRALIREGDSFIEPTSGDTLRIDNIPLASGGGAGRANLPRSLGANSINRKPVQGSCGDLGGVILTATITNLTAGRRFDGLLYIAPLPTSGSSGPFQITSITRSVNNNVNLTWNGQVGNNIVQVSTGLVVGASSGSYSNNFVDLATVVVGCPPTSQTYSDIGGATNRPSRYYRIKLGP